MRRTARAAWRGFWRGAVLLLVFAQAALAAERCVPGWFAGHDAMPVSVAASGHQSLDAHCLTGVAAVDQISASEDKRFLFAAAPPARVAAGTWDASPAARVQLGWIAVPRAGPRLLLQYQNFRL